MSGCRHIGFHFCSERSKAAEGGATSLGCFVPWGSEGAFAGEAFDFRSTKLGETVTVSPWKNLNG